MDSTQLYLVSLGCPKNLVDSEGMLGLLTENGFSITLDPKLADVIVVNTCSFIESAVNESIDVILEMASYKTDGRCRRLIVAGCLPQRFKDNLARSLPEVDVFLGTVVFDRIVDAAKGTGGTSPTCILPNPDRLRVSDQRPRRVRSNPYHTYLKIAEGCDRSCTFCIIPQLRGKQKSRPVPHVLAEAASLISAGVKELILVAQDTTAYGSDLSRPATLLELLAGLSDLPGDYWIRLLYAYPGRVDTDLINMISDRPRICSYLDIPVQHVSQSLLRRMGRGYSTDRLYRSIETIRNIIPGIALRTTLMVGFPGETEDDFSQLIRFVEEIKFDHLGVFMYSDEPDAASHGFQRKVSKSVSQARMDQLMAVQAEISLQKNRSRQDEIHRVLLEEKGPAGRCIGRTEFQAPEIDGFTTVSANHTAIGQFVEVKIFEGLEYDLKGEVVGGFKNKDPV